ncbi:hypothetical protein BJ878DRAFT_568009 [Calycina marina]|uniref:Uncharacterized protein n=1 Tax=Calycina marina TaxID=1763456 RepID=A0A9P7Z1N8_9HELO|nr:hypothetical protein BJ878DRAFT_568009 [Calycina marina]
MAPKTPIPGILFFNSDVINIQSLSRADFDLWYCDEHILDIVRQSGVTYAHRYEFVEDGATPDRKLKYLTLYGMPDLNHMHTKELASLEGQSAGPNKDHVFKNAEFDTPAYATVQFDENKGASKEPAPFLLMATIEHSSPSVLEEWYQGKHISQISKVPTYRRMSRYQFKSRSLLSAFNRSHPTDNQPALALHEFDGPEIP